MDNTIDNENRNVNHEETIYEKNNGFTYTKKGDYFYPNIVTTETKKVVLGKYGRARLNYLKEHKRGL